MLLFTGMKIDSNIERVLRGVTAQSDAEPKFGAGIVRDGKILVTGFARKSAPESDLAEHPLLLIHAEESALLAALREGIDLQGGDVYVLGIRSSGETRLTDSSYSCVVCSRLLEQSGTANVIYPTEDGWKKVSTDEMFQQAIERVREEKA